MMPTPELEADRIARLPIPEARLELNLLINSAFSDSVVARNNVDAEQLHFNALVVTKLRELGCKLWD